MVVKLIYVGTHDEVEVPALGIVAARDVPVEVDAKAAERLLEQDSWEKAPESKPAAKRAEKEKV